MAPEGRPISKKEVISRLKKIEGQARGLQRMIDEGRDCEDVITQLSALRAAINKVSLAVITGQLEECLLCGTRDPDSQEALKRASRLFMKLGR